ncbi:hypothetical protein [Kordiimonas gwangyangensis]|uniref:hypothetical protein n=1 Tax=Kordiimonas gwangyangensis TaxID=288022 RepID=UPI000378612B|nr:hypothetical protein [Kordiimonas gwangyangensis]
MIESISSQNSLHIAPSRISTKAPESKIKIDLDDAPRSKVRVEALHTDRGKGLKIDIKA